MSYRSESPKPTSASIILVEDDTLIADLLCMALRQRFPTTEVKSFVRGREAIEYCRTHKPDVLIADLGLPDMDGRAVIREMYTISPGTRVIVLTGQGSPSLPAELIALGVCGFVDKTSPLDAIQMAVQRVLEGGMYFSASIQPTVTRPPGGVADAADDVPPERLTPREREVARLVASGLVSKEIGDRLNLSGRTVEKIRARILARLGVRDVPGLVRWCVRHGLA